MSDRLLYAIGTGAAVLWRIMIDIDELKSVDDKVVQKIQILENGSCFLHQNDRVCNSKCLKPIGGYGRSGVCIGTTLDAVTKTHKYIYSAQ